MRRFRFNRSTSSGTASRCRSRNQRWQQVRNPIPHNAQSSSRPSTAELSRTVLTFHGLSAWASSRASWWAALNRCNALVEPANIGSGNCSSETPAGHSRRRPSICPAAARPRTAPARSAPPGGAGQQHHHREGHHCEPHKHQAGQCQHGPPKHPAKRPAGRSAAECRRSAASRQTWARFRWNKSVPAHFRPRPDRASRTERCPAC